MVMMDHKDGYYCGGWNGVGVGFPKAHEILDEYAKHVGCSKDKLVRDMTIRREKKNKNYKYTGKS